jgi:hypothetical protein
MKNGSDIKETKRARKRKKNNRKIGSETEKI